MKVKLMADGRTAAGGTPLIMHNERLADPLDPITQALAEVTGKRKKTLEDHAEIARREFFGGLYMNPPVEWPVNGNSAGSVVAIPAWNVLRCLQDGAKRNKRGPDVLRGCSPIGEYATFIYDGPTSAVELWQDGGFSLRKSVGVQRSRTMRTRPIFTDWQVELDIELDLVVADVHTLRVWWKDAGLYSGLGDMRPVYGKFIGTLEEVVEKPARARARVAA